MTEMPARAHGKALRQALRRRTGRRVKSISEVVRATLDEALIERRADLRAARLLTTLLRRPGKARRSALRRNPRFGK